MLRFFQTAFAFDPLPTKKTNIRGKKIRRRPPPHPPPPATHATLPLPLHALNLIPNRVAIKIKPLLSPAIATIERR